VIVAVDGTAASGKGTLAKALAEHFSIPYLETGLLYRAVGLALSQKGHTGLTGSDDEISQAESFAMALSADQLVAPELRGEIAEIMSSRIGAWKQVRDALLAFQHTFIRSSQSQAGGAVLDGRDIGTTICPDAEIKIYVTADLEIRAKRRHHDWVQQGRICSFQHVHEEMRKRDARDENRAVSPLRPAPDAFYIDTSHINPKATLELALKHIASHTHAPHGHIAL